MVAQADVSAVDARGKACKAACTETVAAHGNHLRRNGYACQRGAVAESASAEAGNTRAEVDRSETLPAIAEIIRNGCPVVREGDGVYGAADIRIDIRPIEASAAPSFRKSGESAVTEGQVRDARHIGRY